MKKQISIRGIYTKHMKKINVCAQVQKHPQNQMHTKTSETSQSTLSKHQCYYIHSRIC